ncbi:MAG: type II toxin-antitoxin system VapC family toxin [Bacteroidetes bacterium]|nr:type II toxin-antitoxin system VapC family toxin [Bacteroidota bacterium]
MILLDTSVLINYFRKQKKEDTFFYYLAGLNEPLAISSITKYEILIGKKAGQELFWESLLASLILFPFGDKEASEAADIQRYLLHQNKIIGFGDIAIGATAKANGLKLATLNTKHFERIPQLILIEEN